MDLPKLHKSPLELIVENQRRLVEGLNETKQLLRKVLEEADRADEAGRVRPTTLKEMKAGGSEAKDWLSIAISEFKQQVV